MSVILMDLLELIYPEKCTFCHQRLHGKTRYICEDCVRNLPYTNLDASQAFYDVSRCYSLLYYENEVKESLHRYKFYGLELYAPIYAGMMNASFRIDLMGIDLISWVPLHRTRKRSRGYDQAELIARELSRLSGFPCERLLKKTVNIAPQSSIKGGIKERKENISNVYAPVNRLQIEGKRILIVDDIVTTGATLGECASVLKKNGAAEIQAITVARGRNLKNADI